MSSAKYAQRSLKWLGLEADAVLHLDNGRYALIEFKLGQSEPQNAMRLPDLKLIITGTQYGYRKTDKVLVIPIRFLKD